MKEAEFSKAKQRAGKVKGGIMNGRALFTYQPDLFKTEYDDQAEGEVKKESGQIEEAKVDEGLFGGEGAEEEEDVDFD